MSFGRKRERERLQQRESTAEKGRREKKEEGMREQAPAVVPASFTHSLLSLLRSHVHADGERTGHTERERERERECSQEAERAIIFKRRRGEKVMKSQVMDDPRERSLSMKSM